MEAVFSVILKTALTASFLMAAVMAARLLLRRAPKVFTMVLWGLVALRLLVPFSFESTLSLVPKQLAEYEPAVTTATTSVTRPSVSKPITTVSKPTAVVTQTTVAGSEMTQSVAVVTTTPTVPTQDVSPAGVTTPVSWTAVVSYIWLGGAVLMLCYGVWSYGCVRRRVNASLRLRDNIFACDTIDTPFILGVFRPKIYCPSGMSDEDSEQVVAHEQAHIRHGDHITKWLGFLLLCVYWFHPMVWLSYILFCRDMESACDERVIQSMSPAQKARYAEVLMVCSVSHRAIISAPLSFGEIGVKARLTSILHYKKPTLWVVLASLAAIIVTAVCFLTVPKADAPRTTEPTTSGQITLSDDETSSSTDPDTEKSPSRNYTFRVVDGDGKIILTYVHLKDVTAVYMVNNTSEEPFPVVSITLNEEGTALFAEKTQQHIGEKFAVMLDGETVFEADIHEAITAGEFYIKGGDIQTFKDAEELAYRLMYLTKVFRPSGEYTLPIENWKTDGLKSFGLKDYHMTTLAESVDRNVYMITNVAVDSDQTQAHTALAVETENKVYVIGMGENVNILDAQLCEMDGKNGKEILVCQKEVNDHQAVTVYTVQDSTVTDKSRLRTIFSSEDDSLLSISSLAMPMFRGCVVDEKFGYMWMFEQTDVQPLIGAVYNNEGFPLVSDPFFSIQMTCRYACIDEDGDGVSELALYTKVYSGSLDNAVGEYCTKYRYYGNVSQKMESYDATFIPESDKLKEIKSSSYEGILGEQTADCFGMPLSYPIVQGIGNDTAINQTLPTLIEQCVKELLTTNGTVYNGYDGELKMIDAVYVSYESQTAFSLVYHVTYSNSLSEYPELLSFAVTVNKQSGERLVLEDLADIERLKAPFARQYVKFDKAEYYEPLDAEDYAEMLMSCDQTYDTSSSLYSFVCGNTVCILCSGPLLYYSFVLSFM